MARELSMIRLQYFVFFSTEFLVIKSDVFSTSHLTPPVKRGHRQ